MVWSGEKEVLTEEAVTRKLVKAGFTPRTPDFCAELRRRFKKLDDEDHRGKPMWEKRTSVPSEHDPGSMPELKTATG